MRKKIKYGLIAIAILIPISFIAGHEMAIRSEPFKILKNDIINSSEVRQFVGEVQSISLGWMGYMVRYNGPSGAASFDAMVVGSKGSVRVFADLKRSAGEWQITKTNVTKAE